MSGSHPVTALKQFKMAVNRALGSGDPMAEYRMGIAYLV